MAIMKILRHSDPYSRIKRDVLQDARLSWRARGMLAYLLSLPETWEPHVNHLVQQGVDGRDAVYAIIKELKQYGYIEHRRERDEAGRVLRAYYIVYEEPQTGEDQQLELLPEKPEEAANQGFLPHPAFPDVAKPGLVSPDVLDNKYIKNKTKNKKETAADVRLPQIAAAVLSGQDLIIGSRLTEKQLARIRDLAVELAPVTKIPNELLAAFIGETIVNPIYFCNAGNDFGKKINTVRKAIYAGSWAPPASLVTAEQESRLIKEGELLKQITEVAADYEHANRMLSMGADTKLWSTTRDKAAAKLEALQAQKHNQQVP